MLYEHEFSELHYRKSNSPARHWRGYLLLQVSGGYSSGGRGVRGRLPVALGRPGGELQTRFTYRPAVTRYALNCGQRVGP